MILLPLILATLSGGGIEREKWPRKKDDDDHSVVCTEHDIIS